MAAFAAQAQAVVISSPDVDAVLRAPSSDPGWLNVGTVNGGSAVYLGNRWVITAEHVGSGNFKTTDGREIPKSIGYSTSLNNGALPGSPDLVLFRLAEDPGLPALSIASQAPASGTQVRMIGSGRDRESQLSGWNVTNTIFGPVWSEASPLGSQQIGFELRGDGPMRWGQNVVSIGSQFRTSDATQIFQTTFDYQGEVFEAQATPGDSGGGVFSGADDPGWVLSGIMVSRQPLSGQPSDTVVFGERTAIADLSFYRDQILGLRDRAEPLWQNQINYYDVNASGRVNSSDMLSLINHMLRDGEGEITGSPPPGGPYYDVTGDYRVNSSDLLAIINWLLEQRGEPPLPEAAQRAQPLAESLDGVRIVPEPSTMVLAMVAAVGGLAICRRKRRRAA